MIKSFSNLAITRINNTNSSIYINAIEIYLDLFPQEERQKLSIIDERINSGKEQLYVLTYFEDVIGIALIWNFEQINTNFIDYFAIKKEYQSKGFGFNFLKLLKEQFHKDSIILLEVETPRSNDDLDRNKRIDFYKKSKFNILSDFQYFMPSINGQGKCDMKLMYFSESHDLDNDKRLVYKIVEVIFNEVYNNYDDVKQIKFLNKI